MKSAAIATLVPEMFRDHEFIAPDGARLRVRDVGNVGQSPVLLCLPVGIEPDALEELIDALSETFRVVVSQSRWIHDDSIPQLDASHALDLAAHAGDIEHIINALDLGPVHLVGYCCGGLIAVAAANQLGKRVRSLTLCNGAYVLREEESEYEKAILDLARGYAHRPRLARVIYPTVQERITNVVGTNGIDGENRTRHFTQFRNPETFLKYIQAIRGIFLDEAFQGLQPLQIPALAVSGACDTMTPPSQFDEVRHLLPLATHRVLDGEDHYMPCRAESEAIALIRNFLSNCEHDALRNPEDFSPVARTIFTLPAADHDHATRVLTQQDVACLVTEIGVDALMDRMIVELEAALRAYDERKINVLQREGFKYRTPEVGLIEWMPMLRVGRDAVIKLVGYHPGNPHLNLASIQASICRIDARTGRLSALIEGGFATALRTGAASAIATRLLAASDSRIVGMVGCGAQAVTQLHALSRVMKIDQILAYDADFTALSSFPDRIAFLGLPCRPTSLRELERDCDILCTATSVDVGLGPVLHGHALQPHVHINAVGADLPGKIELPRSLLMDSFVVPDFAAQARLEGECQQLPEDKIGPPLHMLVKNPELAKPHQTKRSIFDSTGFALEDQVVLDVLLDFAQEQGIGQLLELNSSNRDPKNPYAVGRHDLHAARRPLPS